VIHGTYFEPLKFILDGGLNKMARNHIHMVEGFPGCGDVISGMRTSSEVVIEINIVKALMNKVPFHISSNKVILSEGVKGGSLPAEHFRSVTDFKKQKYIKMAPIDYICVLDFEATCHEDKKVKFT
jgi:2'-phosphotransferase